MSRHPRYEYMKQYHRGRHARLAAAGLCVKCGGPRDCDRLHCLNCLKRHAGYGAAYRLRKAEEGLPRCTRCETPFDETPYRTCGLCRAAARAYRQECR